MFSVAGITYCYQNNLRKKKKRLFWVRFQNTILYLKVSHVATVKFSKKVCSLLRKCTQGGVDFHSQWLLAWFNSEVAQLNIQFTCWLLAKCYASFLFAVIKTLCHMEAMKATEIDCWQGQKTFSIMECILKSDFPLSFYRVY